MGVIAIGMAWAMVVPVIRVRTLRENSDFGLSLFITLTLFIKYDLRYIVFLYLLYKDLWVKR